MANERVAFENVNTYALEWTPARISVHGNRPVFNVWIRDEVNMLRRTEGVEVRYVDATTSPTPNGYHIYRFDFGGQATGVIIIT